MPALHVSPKGDDAADGSEVRPLRTLRRAREVSRRQKVRDIVLAEGVYEEPLALDERDNGTRWMARGSEKPCLTTARRLGAEEFSLVEDEASLSRLPPSVRGKVFKADLRRLGFKSINRYPDLFTDSGGIIEVFADGRRLPIARYPKAGFMHMKRVLRNGGGQESPGNWRDYFDPGGKGIVAAPGAGVFEYRDPRTEAWAKAAESGLWLRGYWRVPWQNEAVRVAGIDPVAKTIVLAAPVPGGIGNKYVRPAGSGTEEYLAFNILEELSEPGEWCLDFSTGVMYFYPPAPLESLEVFIADDKAPLCSLKDCEGVELSGLTFAQGGGNGIVVSRGKANLITGCDVGNVTGDGLRVEGGYEHLAQSNDVHDTGGTGIWLSGGDESVIPRRPAGHRIINNHVWNFGVIQRVYAAGINCGFSGGGGGGHHVAVGNLIANNLIHDGPHAGILHGSWDNIIEKNEIFRYCRVSNDMGAIYCYDRYDRSGSRQIRENFIHNSLVGDGIYFDGDTHGDHVTGNKVVGIGGTGFVFKRAFTPANPLLLDVRSNTAVGCGTGYRFVARTGSVIEGNAAIGCKSAFVWISGAQVVGPPAQGDVSSGPNPTIEHLETTRASWGCANGAAALDNAPCRWGLFTDAHRRALPSDTALDRFTDPPRAELLSYAIKDRVS